VHLGGLVEVVVGGDPIDAVGRAETGDAAAEIVLIRRVQAVEAAREDGALGQVAVAHASRVVFAGGDLDQVRPRGIGGGPVPGRGGVVRPDPEGGDAAPAVEDGP